MWKSCKSGITQVNTLNKIYKLKDQFDNEGSLDAHTTDVLAFASHPASSVKFKEAAVPAVFDPDKVTVQVPGFNLSFICNLSATIK